MITSRLVKFSPAIARPPSVWTLAGGDGGVSRRTNCESRSIFTRQKAALSFLPPLQPHVGLNLINMTINHKLGL